MVGRVDGIRLSGMASQPCPSTPTGDPVRLIPCMGVLEADEGKFLFKLFRYSSANKFF